MFHNHFSIIEIIWTLLARNQCFYLWIFKYPGGEGSKWHFKGQVWVQGTLIEMLNQQGMKDHPEKWIIDLEYLNMLIGLQCSYILC